MAWGNGAPTFLSAGRVPMQEQRGPCRQECRRSRQLANGPGGMQALSPLPPQRPFPDLQTARRPAPADLEARDTAGLETCAGVWTFHGMKAPNPEGIASISLLPSQYALALARPGRAACRQVKTATSCTEPMGHTHRNLSSRSADIPVGIASSIPRSANQAP